MLITALSVKQPWANLIASGQKTIETRTWATKYRGPLLIVSSKIPSIPPPGCALAIVDLVDCRRMRNSDWGAAMCDRYGGAFGWVFENIRRITPFPVRGHQGLYKVEVDSCLINGL